MPGPTRFAEQGEVTLATLNAIRAAYRAELQWARGKPGRSPLSQLRAAAMEKRQAVDKEREIRAAKRKVK